MFYFMPILRLYVLQLLCMLLCVDLLPENPTVSLWPAGAACTAAVVHTVDNETVGVWPRDRLLLLSLLRRQELLEQLQETREEKKRIRKNLREYEDQFFQENGR